MSSFWTPRSWLSGSSPPVSHISRRRATFTIISVGGKLVGLVPPLVIFELLNAAARRWGWETYQLETFAGDLELLGLEVRQPALVRVAHWCARGLTAYDAAYVALAEERRTVVVSEDEQIITVARDLARKLGQV